MGPVTSGSLTSYDLFQALWGEVRHLLTLLLWLLASALVAAAACWYCAYGVREAWIRGGPPLRRPRRPGRRAGRTSSAAGARTLEEDVEQALEPVLVEEAERGIVAIEAYLACAGDGGAAGS